MTAGAYPLLGTGDLPNVAIASPGEVWSNARALQATVPGSLVFPVNNAGALYYDKVDADNDTFVKDQLAVAMRQVEIPDVNTGPSALGPNEIVNQTIAADDYLRYYKSGVLTLSLVVPDDGYVPGELIGWDDDGVRPAGKAAGTGAWCKAADGIANTDIFELLEVRYYGTDDESLLTVRFVGRSNQ